MRKKQYSYNFRQKIRLPRSEGAAEGRGLGEEFRHDRAIKFQNSASGFSRKKVRILTKRDIHIINTSTQAATSKIVKSELFMRKLSEGEINQYLEQDSHYNAYALGFDPLRNISSSFITKLVGSYNNVLRGIPLEVVLKMLPEVGYKL